MISVKLISRQKSIFGSRIIHTDHLMTKQFRRAIEPIMPDKNRFVVIKTKRNLSGQRVFRNMNQILLTGARNLVNRLKRQTRLPPLHSYILR